MISTTYFYYPWGINILQDSGGKLLTVIIRNLEDERESTVVYGHD